MQLIHAKATIDELSSRISIMEVNMKHVRTTKLNVFTIAQGYKDIGFHFKKKL